MKKATIVKVVIGVVVIGSALSYFVFQAMKSSWSYYYSVDEFAEKRDVAMDYSLRLAGTVKAGSVARDLQEVKLNFVLAGEESQVPVQYAGVVPDNFSEGREVLVDGRITPAGVFEADTVITKCESKYKAKLE